MADAVLLIQEPDGALREIPLIADRTILGRDATCNVLIAARLISRQHAAITRAGGVYTLEDLGSRNGTTVNDQPVIGPQKLYDGDRIELGGVGRLTFLDGDATNTRPMPALVGVWLETGTQDVWVDGRCLAPRLSPAQFSLLQLLVANADRICSRDEIVTTIWPDTADGISDEAIDGLIKRVRARLAEVPDGQRYLVTLRGRGLMLRSARNAPKP